MGDGLMVEFGAPLDDPHQEAHAILAAIAMQRKAAELSDEWEKQGRLRLEMGVGIHVGQVVVGNVGSEKRMEYTAIGDPVNIASRLETKSKSLNKPIIVSQDIYDKTKELFVFEDLKEVDIRGREGSIHVWAIFPDKQGDLDAIKKKLTPSVRVPEGGKQ
jgi:adenylate cyclase